VSRLLKSWATPAASCPIASSFCERWSCSARSLRSVTSMAKPRTNAGAPSGPRTSTALERSRRNVPSAASMRKSTEYERRPERTVLLLGRREVALVALERGRHGVEGALHLADLAAGVRRARARVEVALGEALGGARERRQRTEDPPLDETPRHEEGRGGGRRE